MRKVILSLAVSLDGYIEGPNGEYDWCFTDQDYGFPDFMKQVDTVFMGRKSYEMMQGMEEESGLPAMKEYIFSQTLTAVKKGMLVGEDLRTAVNGIKAEKGKDIWLFGGAGLTTSMLAENLVDEIHLAIHPILLGAGKPLFQGIKDRIGLKLLDVRSYSTGLVMVKYGLGKA